MAMNRTAWLTLPTTVSATPDEELGSKREWLDGTYGWQILRYVRNMSGGNVTAGLGVMQENGTDKYECILSGAGTPNVRVMGVGITTIPNLSYGWVLCEGFGLFVSNGTTGANAPQICAANGQFTDGTAVTSEAIVLASVAQAVPAGTFTGYIRAF